MMTGKKTLAIFLVVLIAVSTGCVSQSPVMEPKQVTEEPPAPPAEEPVKELPKVEPKPAPQPQPKEEPKEPAKEKTPADELKEYIGKWPQEYHLQYKVTYFVGEDITELLQSEYFKVDKRRIDLFIDEGEQFTNTRAFFLPDKTVTCTSLNGEEEFCIKTEKSEAQTDFTKVEQANFDEYAVTREEPQRIAGDQTHCYKLVKNSDASEMAICYAFDGIPLSLATLGKQDGVDTAITVEAELLERRVPDSELEAPSAQSLEEMAG